MRKCGGFWLKYISKSQSIYILFQALQEMWWIMGTRLLRKERGRGSTNELKTFYKLQMENIMHCLGNNYEEMNGLTLLYVLKHTEGHLNIFLGDNRFCSPFLGHCQTRNIMFSRRQTNPMGYHGCSWNSKVTDSDKWQLVRYSWGSNYRWNNVGLKWIQYLSLGNLSFE